MESPISEGIDCEKKNPVFTEKDQLDTGIHDLIIDGLNLHYEISGQGLPLLLMHGWGCTHSTVSSIARVASQHNKVINIDLPGFGKSSEPPINWGVEEYTQLIERFLAVLDIKNPILIGHSFGGRIGILYASRNSVSKLVLVDAAGIKPKRKASYYIKVYRFKFFKNIIKLIYSKEKATEIINKMRSKKGSSDYRDASPVMKAILSRTVNQDLRKFLPLIKASTLLIWGAKDTATPISDAKLMERLIPDAGLVSFDNAGHYSFLDNPYGFNAVLNSFLST